MKKILRLVAALAIVLVPAITATKAGAVSATESPTQNGLKISPVRNTVTVQPGSTGKVDVFVQNVTNTPATVRAVVNDFVASSDETGQPDLILDENQYAASHSLKRFISPIGNVTLRPNEQKQVTVNVVVPKNAAGGGYYGAVRFVPVSSAGNADTRLSLSASVGSLIIARVPGDIKESLSVASFDVRRNNVAHRLFTSPDDLVTVMRFQNQGNIQVEPFGKLVVKDRSGKVVMQTEINNTDPRGNVLPDSIRRFDVNLVGLKKIGVYTLQGNFGYGTTGQLITAETKIYIVPLPYIIAAVILLLVLILAIIFIPKGIKAYNKRILRNARYRR